MSEPSLFMTRMSIDRPGMLRFGSSFGIPPELADEGYPVHALLRALFGEFAPQPFGSRPSPGRALAIRDTRAFPLFNWPIMRCASPIRWRARASISKAS